LNISTTLFCTLARASLGRMSFGRYTLTLDRRSICDTRSGTTLGSRVGVIVDRISTIFHRLFAPAALPISSSRRDSDATERSSSSTTQRMSTTYSPPSRSCFTTTPHSV
jgi:hypothetical protein